jgi:hypothetical protein
MSLYEGLSLVLSTVGTIFTVFLGFRQLGRAAPATASAVPVASLGVAAPSAGWGNAAPTHGSYTAPPPYPGHQYRPVPPPVASGSTPYRPPGMPTSPYPPAPAATWYPPAAAPPAYSAPSQVRTRPKPVRTASMLLFAVAALQPVVLLTYYGIEYAMNAERASADFSDAGAADIAVFGVIAVLCGILGIFVARGSRVAAWCVWASGILAVPFAILIALAIVLAMVMPNEDTTAAGLLAVVVVYLLVVSIAIAWSAILLLNSQARAFFFGARR